MATDDDMDGWFEVREAHDHAQAALDQWHADHAKDTRRDPGLVAYVVDTRPPQQR